jgi:TonB family protein
MTTLLLTLIWKSAILVALAAAIAWLGRRASAATRHTIWTAGLGGLLLLPAALTWTPSWPLPASLPLQALPPAARTVLTVTADAGSHSWIDYLLPLWAAGSLLLLLRLTVRQWLAYRLARRAQYWSRFEDADVLLSSRTAMPFVCGIVNPVVILPQIAPNWPQDQLRAVLRHESAHVLRRDPLIHALASLACALYWPLPWVWAAASRIRLEAELACDDGVLQYGERPSDYATHLMQVVRGLADGERVPEGVIPMARMSDLELRLRAMLATNTSRGPAGSRLQLTAALAALSLLLPLAAFRAPAFAADGGIQGIVRDASGATVPKARVVLLFQGSPRKEAVLTNDVGEFSFSPVPDGTFVVRVLKPGFVATDVSGITVRTGASDRLQITLNPGQVSESLTVVGERPNTEPTPSGAAPQRIRVGGNVQATRLVKQPRPSYPADCKAQGVEGSVMFRAVIGKTGEIVNLQQINELVDARLADAARAAVSQWRYEPTLLNGQPVEVVTDIDVNFTLAR